ncbi:MAG: glycosyltransferase family 9 protein, partial [Elusimicrobia bacterium]|nr:glycosyltransferase family 9 protein [Elusimicrobiota bacterium]
QLRRIGDVLLATPAVKALRLKFPDARIDFLAEPPCHEILAGNPDINEILVYDKNSPLLWIRKVRARQYDMVIDFLGNPRSGLLTFLSGAKIKAGSPRVFCRYFYNTLFTAGSEVIYAAEDKVKMLSFLDVPTLESYIPQINICAQDAEWAQNICKDFFSGEEIKIALSPQSRRITRRWPAEHFAELIKLLASSHNCKIMLLWGPGEYDTAKKIAELSDGAVVVAPETKTLGKLAALLSRFDILIGCRNGTSHIAAAVGCQTLIIHGMCNPKAWTPPNNHKHQAVFMEKLNCFPCGKTVCPKKLECLYGLSPQIVFDKYTEMMKRIWPK